MTKIVIQGDLNKAIDVGLIPLKWKTDKKATSEVKDQKAKINLDLTPAELYELSSRLVLMNSGIAYSKSVTQGHTTTKSQTIVDEKTVTELSIGIGMVSDGAKVADMKDFNKAVYDKIEEVIGGNRDEKGYTEEEIAKMEMFSQLGEAASEGSDSEKANQAHLNNSMMMYQYLQQIFKTPQPGNVDEGTDYDVRDVLFLDEDGDPLTPNDAFALDFENGVEVEVGGKKLEGLKAIRYLMSFQELTHETPYQKDEEGRFTGAYRYKAVVLDNKGDVVLRKFDSEADMVVAELTHQISIPKTPEDKAKVISWILENSKKPEEQAEPGFFESLLNTFKSEEEPAKLNLADVFQFEVQVNQGEKESVYHVAENPTFVTVPCNVEHFGKTWGYYPFSYDIPVDKLREFNELLKGAEACVVSRSDTHVKIDFKKDPTKTKLVREALELAYNAHRSEKSVEELGSDNEYLNKAYLYLDESLGEYANLVSAFKVNESVKYDPDKVTLPMPVTDDARLVLGGILVIGFGTMFGILLQTTKLGSAIAAKAENEVLEKKKNELVSMRSQDFFEKFGRDLIKEASEGKIVEAVGRDAEIATVFATWMQEGKGISALIGPAGGGKTLIAENVALHMYRRRLIMIKERELRATGELARDQHLTRAQVESYGLKWSLCPDFFAWEKLYEISLLKMVAGTSLRGELDIRVDALIEHLKKDPEIKVAIDELFDAIKSADSVNEDPKTEIVKNLKADIARGTFKGIFTLTDEDYNKITDPQIKRRMQPNRVSPTEGAVLSAILTNSVESMQNYVRSLGEFQRENAPGLVRRAFAIATSPITYPFRLARNLATKVVKGEVDSFHQKPAGFSNTTFDNVRFAVAPNVKEFIEGKATTFPGGEPDRSLTLQRHIQAQVMYDYAMGDMTTLDLKVERDGRILITTQIVEKVIADRIPDPKIFELQVRIDSTIRSLAQYGYSVESLGFNLDAFRPQTDEDIRSRIERLININRALNSLLLVNNRSEVTEVTAAEKDAKLAEVVETFERLGTPKPEASKAGPEVAWEEKIMRHLATLEESYGIDAKELGVDAEAFEKIEDNRTNLRDQIDRLMAINRAIEALVNQMKQAERLGVDPQETESLIENVRDAYIIAVPDEPIDYAKLWDPVSRVEVNCGVVATAFEKMDADLARTFASKYGTGTVMLSDILGKLDADVFESVSKAYISKGESPSASWPRAMVYQLVLAQAEFEGTDIPAGKSADGLFAVNRAYADHMIRFHNPEKSYAKPKTTSPAYQAQEALRNRLKTLIEKADRRAALTKSRLSAK